VLLGRSAVVSNGTFRWLHSRRASNVAVVSYTQRLNSVWPEIRHVSLELPHLTCRLPRDQLQLPYARYTLPVLTGMNTAREHGRHFWTPVSTGHRDHQALLLMTSLFSTCRTGVRNYTRVHGPCSRPVNTSSVYRPLGYYIHLQNMVAVTLLL